MTKRIKIGDIKQGDFVDCDGVLREYSIRNGIVADEVDEDGYIRVVGLWSDGDDFNYVLAKQITRHIPAAVVLAAIEKAAEESASINTAVEIADEMGARR